MPFTERLSEYIIIILYYIINDNHGIYIYIYIYNYDDDIRFICTKIGSYRPIRSCGKKIIVIR